MVLNLFWILHQPLCYVELYLDLSMLQLLLLLCVLPLFLTYNCMLNLLLEKYTLVDTHSTFSSASLVCLLLLLLFLLLLRLHILSVNGATILIINQISAFPNFLKKVAHSSYYIPSSHCKQEKRNKKSVILSTLLSSQKLKCYKLKTISHSTYANNYCFLYFILLIYVCLIYWI